MKRISDLKVPELHDELTKRGLSKKGKKQELINVSKNCVGGSRDDLCVGGLMRLMSRMCVGVQESGQIILIY